VARKHVSATYRSGLEEKVSAQLTAAGVTFTYEDEVIRYTSPETPHRYTPDFHLPNNIVVETKGIFDAADRKKHLLIRDQHPHLDIRFVFTRSKTTLSKASKTSYGDWCDANGFLYADKLIPLAWIEESTK
jgi:Phage endonuclease I